MIWKLRSREWFFLDSPGTWLTRVKFRVTPRTRPRFIALSVIWFVLIHWSLPLPTWPMGPTQVMLLNFLLRRSRNNRGSWWQCRLTRGNDWKSWSVHSHICRHTYENKFRNLLFDSEMMQLFESLLFLGHAIVYIPSKSYIIETCDRGPSRVSTWILTRLSLHTSLLSLKQNSLIRLRSLRILVSNNWQS